MMRFGLGKCIAILGAAALLLICSCEKHRVGELPETHKEHADSAKPPGHHQPAAPAGTSTSPTPAEFFPEGHR
jgi:hypothetical protein